ncbi:MAG: hypothetical protein ACI4UJ_07180 [Candidatus Cryptobacteroides sp.]
MMKRLSIFLAALLAAGCAESIEEETISPSDAEDCAGVYFPFQAHRGSNLVEPSDRPEKDYRFTLTLKRSETDGAITVPITVSDDEGVFSVPSSVDFADGQRAAEIEVCFPGIKTGKTYPCRISIDDPAYASLYSRYPASFEFSVMVVNWVKLEEGGSWRDDVVRANFQTASSGYAENTSVTFYEREDLPGYYRVDNAYTRDYMAAIAGGNGLESAFTYSKSSIFIDATDPAKVWIPACNTGLSFGSYGAISIASVVNANVNTTIEYYGTLKDGIIEFPQQGLLMGMSGSWYYGNTSAMHRIVLPGHTTYNFSMNLSADVPENGKTPVKFKAGSGISNFKYTVVPGKIGAVQAKEIAEGIAGGTVGNVTTVNVEEGILSIECDATGEYTFVCANFSDKQSGTDEYVGYNYVHIKYLAEGDDVPIDLIMNLYTTDRFSSVGITSENSLEFYARGSGIETGYFHFERGDVNAMDKEELINKFKNSIMSGDAVPAEPAAIDLLNGDGYAMTMQNLEPATRYSAFAYVTNGYKWDLVSVVCDTKGKISELDNVYSKDQLKSSSIDDMTGKWDMYAIDVLAGGGSHRTLIGTVTSSKAFRGGRTVLNFKGLLGPDESIVIGDEGVDFVFRNGFAYSTTTMFGKYNYNNVPVYAAIGYLGNDGSRYPYFQTQEENLIIAGMLENGNIALVDNQAYFAYRYTFNGLGLTGYDRNTEDMASTSMYNILHEWSLYKNILLVKQK